MGEGDHPPLNPLLSAAQALRAGGRQGRGNESLDSLSCQVLPGYNTIGYPNNILYYNRVATRT